MMKCIIVMVLLGCIGSALAANSIQQDIQNIKQQQIKNNSVEVNVKTAEPQQYRKSHLRDPFQTQQGAKSNTYQNVILRQFSLSQLLLVGTIVHKDKSIAIIQPSDDNNKKLYRVAIGTRIGKSQALVSKISQNKVELTLDVQTDLGIQKQTVTMTLQEPKE